MTDTIMENELMQRALFCLANVAAVSRHLGGIDKLAQKLVKRSDGCRTSNLTVNEALLLSWALGVSTNMQLASVDIGLQELKQRNSANRDAFRNYADAQQANTGESKPKRGRRNGAASKGRGAKKVPKV